MLFPEDGKHNWKGGNWQINSHVYELFEKDCVAWDVVV